MAIIGYGIVIISVTMGNKLTRQQRERHGCTRSIAEAMEYEMNRIEV